MDDANQAFKTIGANRSASGSVGMSPDHGITRADHDYS
jgi:hypothetical protein